MEYALTQDWEYVKDIMVYGFGRIAKDNLSYFIKSFQIQCIIESDKTKCGCDYENIPIIHINDAIKSLKTHKIIIMTGERNAISIGKMLMKLGLEKNKDFCSLECFITEWFWRFRQKICLMEVHTAVTTRCTLKCKNCNMFIPYYKDPRDYNMYEIKEDIDALFKSVDYLFTYMLLGGEPLLNSGLPKIIEYLGYTYGNRIGNIGIITNGTVMPSMELLEVSRKYNVKYSISDYTNAVDYGNYIDKMIDLLEKKGITYTRNNADYWCDFGFPGKAAIIDKNNIKEHMLECGPVFHGLNDKKLFYCHVSWSADKCKLFKMSQKDYVDLDKIVSESDKLKIIEHCRGNIGKDKNGYVGLCAVCGGCGNDNQNHVAVAEQKERLYLCK